MKRHVLQLHIDVQLDYWFAQPCDVLLHIEAAAVAGQVIEDARMMVTPYGHFARVAAHDGVGERIWLRVEGQMLVEYQAVVSIDRIVEDWAALPAVPPRLLPVDAIQYLLPSRYCQSDLFADFAESAFGALDGGAKIDAMRDWVSRHLSYVPGASDAGTTAVDTFRSAQGICRDYAHLLISLARAADIPARFASVYGPGVTPADFHAVAEIFLGGRWHLVDATGMAGGHDMAKIGIGRDVGDVAFLTAFGPMVMNGQTVCVRAGSLALAPA